MAALPGQSKHGRHSTHPFPNLLIHLDPPLFGFSLSRARVAGLPGLRELRGGAAAGGALPGTGRADKGAGLPGARGDGWGEVR